MTSVDGSIRVLGRSDAADMAAVHRAAVDGEVWASAWREETYARFAADPSVTLIGALDDETLSGFVAFRTAGGEAEILMLAVAPACRRRGMAGRLVDAVLASCIAAGLETVTLEVADGNAAALALYDRAGFAPVGRRKAYYRSRDGGRIDALVLQRALSPTI